MGDPDFEKRELERRVGWLLVFRAVVATGLLATTLTADLAALPLRMMSGLLYGVAIGTFAVVIVLGLLLRSGVSAIIVSAAYLATAVFSSYMVVEGSGGIESPFSFLYLLSVLDGAIVGGRRVSLAVATGATLAFGLQIVLEVYGLGFAILPARARTWEPVTVFTLHVAAFYLVAILAGRLATQAQHARQAVRDAQADLRAAEEMQAAVLDSLPIGVITLDAAHQARSANRTALEILAVGLTELLTGPMPAPLAEVISRGTPLHDVAVTINGRRLHLAVAIAPLRGAHGASSVLVLEDRTEIAVLEESLQAKARLASVGELSAALAHELRNPLAAISGSVELLDAGVADAHEEPRLRQIMLREITRLNELVSDFLLYARPAQPQRVPTDLRELLDAVQQQLDADDGGGALALVLKAPSHAPVRADGQQMRRFLVHLLRFVRELTPPGQSFNAESAPTDDTPRPGWRLSIHGKAKVLPEDTWARLYEPFAVQVGGRRTLGLAVARRIAENHGGVLEVQRAGLDELDVELRLPPA